MIDRIVGNYRIVEKVGEGGMGAVYRALDLMLEREVAIKAIRPELSQDPEIVERFRAEAKMAARVAHPAIATIFSFFVEDDELFLAMEFVHGRSLSQVLLQGGPLPWEQAVSLLDQALDGIEQAHRAGIVHRDLKPDNLMITEAGRVKVMDFGIARAVGSGRLTRTGLLIGTLRYMAPEQIRGEEVDRRTDVYALGTVLYEMLTGRVPFDGTSDYAVLKAQVEEDPMPPSRAVAGLPGRLDQAILRALAKEPAERFQTVEEMRRFLLGQGVAGGPPPLAAALPPGTSSGTWSAAIAEQPTLVTTPTPPPGRQTAPPAPAPGTGVAAAAAAATTASRQSAPSYRDVQLVPPKGSPRRRLAPLVALAFAAVVAVAIALPQLRRSAAAPAMTPAAGPAAPTPAPGTAGAGVATAGVPAAGAGQPPLAATAGAVPPGGAAGSGAGTLPAGGTGAASAGAARPHAAQRRRETEAAAEPSGAAPAADAAGSDDDDSKPTAGADAGTAGAAETTTARLRRLGAEISQECGDIRGLYASALTAKQRRGQSNSTAEEQLQKELTGLHSAAEQFREQFPTGLFARARTRLGRLGRGEEESTALVKRLAQGLSDAADRVDPLVTTAQPEPGIQVLWHHLHRLCKQVAALCGL